MLQLESGGGQFYEQLVVFLIFQIECVIGASGAAERFQEEIGEKLL